MSDGNFNKSLLPHGDVASGVRVGRAQMRAQALQVLSEVLQAHAPALSADVQAQILQAFRERIHL